MEPVNTEQTPQPANNQTVSDNWPGAYGVYKTSKQAVKMNLETLVLIGLLNIIVGSSLGFVFRRGGNFLGLVLGSYTTAALVIVFLASVRGKKISIKEALSDALSFWLKMIGLELLIMFSLIGSFLLFIVPFFFVLPRLLMAEYFLIDKDMDVLEAYKASWHATKGHSGKVWGIIGASISMALLALTIIGIPFAVYFLIMYSAAFAVLYLFIAKHTTQTKAVPS